MCHRGTIFWFPLTRHRTTPVQTDSAPRLVKMGTGDCSGNDRAGAFVKFGQGTDPFTQWFKAQVKDIHGIDLDAPPPGPLPKQVVDSGG